MFRPWKLLTASGVLVYELLQVQFWAPAWIQNNPNKWTIAVMIAMLSLVWSQFRPPLKTRWRTAVGIFCFAIFVLILVDGKVGYLVALFDEAFTGVAIGETVLYFSPGLKRRLQ